MTSQELFSCRADVPDVSRWRSSEQGFSALRLLIWLALLGFVVFNGALLFQAYYTNWKVQGCFESLVNNSEKITSTDPQARLERLFSLQYMQHNDLPDEFYEQLQINTSGRMMEVSSSYQITIWPFGRVQAVGEQGAYDSEALRGMDAWRDRTRIELLFEPYAITRAGER